MPEDKDRTIENPSSTQGCESCKKEVELALFGQQLESFSKALDANTEITQRIHDRLCVDTPDGKSMQSQVLLNSQKIKWQWAASVVILTSLLGLSFFLLQEKIKDPLGEGTKKEPKKVQISSTNRIAENEKKTRDKVVGGQKVALLAD